MSKPDPRDGAIVSKPDTGDGDAVRFGVASASDMVPAARIYLESFPGRLIDVCGSERGAEHFCLDLMEFMRLSYGSTFFTAHYADALAGYLILTVPGRGTPGRLLSRGFLLRATFRLVSGRYGSVVGIARRGMSRARARPEDSVPADLHSYPHVYVVAVGNDWRSRGIGARLLCQARDAVAGEFPQLWLSVDIDNAAAVRFYERLGMRIVASGNRQHHMVWTFTDGRLSAASPSGLS